MITCKVDAKGGTFQYYLKMIDNYPAIKEINLEKLNRIIKELDRQKQMQYKNASSIDTFSYTLSDEDWSCVVKTLQTLSEHSLLDKVPILRMLANLKEHGIK
ncbi:MAG: hypothetical protein ACK4NC_06230 [Candidatus Gracilibacteria bacterium]